METWDAIRARRNVRSYAKQAIAPQDLDQILEAACRSPSAGNQQLWDFIVCTDPEQLAQLARVWRSAGHVARSAATIALVAPIPEDARTRDLVQYDLGQAGSCLLSRRGAPGDGSGGWGFESLAARNQLVGAG